MPYFGLRGLYTTVIRTDSFLSCGPQSSENPESGELKWLTSLYTQDSVQRWRNDGAAMIELGDYAELQIWRCLKQLGCHSESRTT
jgi:hypothetical protein